MERLYPRTPILSAMRPLTAATFLRVFGRVSPMQPGDFVESAGRDAVGCMAICLTALLSLSKYKRRWYTYTGSVVMIVEHCCAFQL